MTPELELAGKLARLAKLQAGLAPFAPAADAVTFARLRMRVSDTRTGLRIPLAPDPWQARVLNSKARRLLLCCSRQSGKSTTAAALAVYHAIHRQNALVLLVSPSDRQSKELFRKVMGFLRGMRNPPELLEDNKSSATLANGSRIVSLPCSEETIRGFSGATLLIEDEAGDVPDDLYHAVRPMLIASGGQFVLMGTPKGRRGHFFEAWEHGGEGWARVRVTAHDCPRITAEDLAEERRALGPLIYAQEYECEFLNAAAGLVYDGWTPDLCRIDALPVDPSKGRPWTYALGLDFGIVDHNGVSVLATRRYDRCVYVVTAYRLEGGIEEVGREIARLSLSYAFEQVIGDVGGMGKAFQYDLGGRFRVHVQAAEKHNKVGHVAMLNAAMRQGQLKIVGPQCADLIHEYETLPWAVNKGRSDKRQKEADGFDNHAADATLYAWRGRSAYLEGPEPPKHGHGTAAKFAEDEDAELERAVQDAKRKAWERPATTGGSWKGKHPLTSGLLAAKNARR